MQNNGKVILNYGDGKIAEFPTLSGTLGPDVIVIRALYS